MKLHVLGIDLGKTVFHAVGLDATGKVVIRKKCSRRQLLVFTANLEVELIGMESCSGSHFLGRALREQGHEVRLMPAQYVKPYVQTNKSDFLDAEAIAEALQRPRMRFVPNSAAASSPPLLSHLLSHSTCPRFLFVDTNQSAHKGHLPQLLTLRPHVIDRALTFRTPNSRMIVSFIVTYPTGRIMSQNRTSGQLGEIEPV